MLYNQANNLARNAQSLSSDATGDFSAIVFQEGRRQEEIAKIIARGRVAAQVLQLLQDPRAELKVDQWRLQRRGEGGDWEVVPGTKTPPPTEPNDDEIMLNQEQKVKLFSIVTNNCLACHSADKKKAGLDMTRFLSFDKLTRQRIVKTLTAENPDDRMPKAEGGVPGKPLSKEEIDLFYAAAGLVREE